MALLGRILVIVFALLLGSLAAGAVLVLALLLPGRVDLPADTLDGGILAVLIGVGAIFFSAVGLVPALLTAIAAEALGIRSVLVYAAAGALTGFLTYWNLGWLDFDLLGLDGFARREVEILIASGIAAGTVYWAVAGRNAGRWRDHPHDPRVG
jgi:hypothetical protein